MPDDDLRDLDLSAWQAPPPPAGLADAVIARMHEPPAVAALEPEARPARAWWLAAAGVAVIAAAVVALVIARGGTERAAPAFGGIAAARPQRLELATVSAELDAGAVVTWHREPDALVAAQPRGTAAWRVDAADHLRIETGVAGTSVEATGASLRVEDHMNLSDARVIGASTLTAAAVAFVTVVVYDGHVKATSGGQTVQIEPGSTIELRAGRAPEPPPLVGAASPAPTPPQAPPATVTAASLGREAISAGIAAVRPAVDACGTTHPASGIVKIHFRVAPDGTVSDATVTGTPDAALGTCVAAAVKTAQFAPSRDGGAASYPFRFDTARLATPPAAACDADALEQHGMQLEAVGNHAASLKAFDDAIRCKPSRRLEALAFMAACNAQDRNQAKLHYQKLDPAVRSRMIPMCIRRGIAPPDLEP